MRTTFKRNDAKKFFIFGVVSTIMLCTAQPLGQAVQADTYSIDPADIVDWNTDGNELSMCLSDGSECYAYKQEDCFTVKKRDYLPLKDIADVRVVKNGFYIIDSNGEEYYIAKNEEK